MTGQSNRVKILKKIAALMLATLILEGAGYLYGLQPSHIIYHYTLYQRDKTDLEQKYGVDIVGILEPKDYPARWTDSPLLAEQTIIRPISNRYDISRLLKSILDALKMYPPTLLKKNLNHIFLLNQITIHGNSGGGTYSATKKSVYIENPIHKGVSLSDSKSNLIKTFHHEFSSILIKNYEFETQFWRNAMEVNFQYESDKNPFFLWLILRGQADPIEPDVLLGRGLLRQYAETGVENDFNTYAEVIFTEPSRMSQLIQDYPLIAKKYHVFKAFYLSIDPGFAPVFEKIDNQSNLPKNNYQ